MPLNHELAQSSNRSRTGSAGQSDSRSQRCLFCLQTHNWSSRPSQSWAVLYHGSQKVLQSTRLAYLILYSQINKQRSSLELWTRPMNTTTNTGVTLKWLSPGMQVNTRDINFTKGTSSTAIYLTAVPSSSPGFQSGSDSGHPRFQISSSFLSLQQFSAADLPAPQVWAWSWAETHACTECWAHLSLVTTTPWRRSSSPSGVVMKLSRDTATHREHWASSPFFGHHTSQELILQPLRCEHEAERRHMHVQSAGLTFLWSRQLPGDGLPAPQVWLWSWAETQPHTESTGLARLSLATTLPRSWSSSPSGVVMKLSRDTATHREHWASSPFFGHHTSQELILQPLRCEHEAERTHMHVQSAGLTFLWSRQFPGDGLPVPQVWHKVQLSRTGRLEEMDILAALTFHYNNSNSSRCCRSSAVIMNLNTDTLADWGKWIF